MPLNTQDLTKIQSVVHAEVEPIKQDVHVLQHDINKLTTSVDSFLRIVRRHEQEWLVLRAQHEKIRNILVKKGIATEDELAVA